MFCVATLMSSKGVGFMLNQVVNVSRNTNLAYP